MSIELIVCLDSEDICYTTPDLVCRENYGYQCGKYICTLNACINIFSSTHAFIFMFALSHIK